jgi:hypothetical protein
LNIVTGRSDVAGIAVPEFKETKMKTVSPSGYGRRMGLTSISWESAGAVLVGFSLLLGGCATPNPHVEYAPASLGTSAISRQLSGLEISVDPVFDTTRSEQYFKSDALAYGILAIHVAISNSSTKTSYLLREADLKLTLNTGAQASQSPSGTGTRTGVDQAIGIGAVAVLSPALMWAEGIKLISSRAVQYNYAQAELRDQTLSAGRSASGFVYFKVSRGDAQRGGVLKMTLKALPSQESVEVDFPVNP